MGQPQIQQGEATDISEYIEENLTDVNEPRYGFGEWDGDVLEQILFGEHMDMMKELGDQSIQKKIKKLEDEREKNKVQTESLNLESVINQMLGTCS